jgi:hypothetical protein
MQAIEPHAVAIDPVGPEAAKGRGHDQRSIGMADRHPLDTNSYHPRAGSSNRGVANFQLQARLNLLIFGAAALPFAPFKP